MEDNPWPGSSIVYEKAQVPVSILDTVGGELLLVDCPNGMNADTPYESDMTSLHIASRNADVTTLAFLISSRLDVNSFCSVGTPLHMAARAGNTDCIDMLLQAGAHIDAACPEGLSPILTAAMAGQSEAVSMLVMRGAKLDQCLVPGCNYNLLHVCVDQDLPECVNTILQSNQGRALALCATGKQLKPVHMAAMNSHNDRDTEMLDMLMPFSGIPSSTSRADLIQQGADIEGTSSSSQYSDSNPFTKGDSAPVSTPRADNVVHSTSNLSDCPVSLPLRMFFTPTANLDCSPADCSPASHFHVGTTDPPIQRLCSSPAPTGMASPLGSCTGMQWDSVDCVRPPLRIKTRVSEAGLSSLHISHHHGSTSSHASSASAMMMRRMGNSTPGYLGDFPSSGRSYDQSSSPIRERNSPPLYPDSHATMQ